MSLELKNLLKWPLIIAAVLIVARIISEQAGAPESVNNLFGVAWLYFIVPIVFAFQIAAAQEPHPYKTLFKSLLVFITGTRLMIMPTYWLAYALNWSSPRFGVGMGGVVGEGVSPLAGYLGIPIRNALLWIVTATLVGLILGGITLAIKRRRPQAHAVS